MRDKQKCFWNRSLASKWLSNFLSNWILHEEILQSQKFKSQNSETSYRKDILVHVVVYLKRFAWFFKLKHAESNLTTLRDYRLGILGEFLEKWYASFIWRPGIWKTEVKKNTQTIYIYRRIERTQLHLI